MFDDIHWAEPAFARPARVPARIGSSGAPILLLCIARQELLEEPTDVRGHPRPNASSILLEPLPQDASHELIENLLGSVALEPSPRRASTAAAEGNPLFVEEMLRMLIDDGSLVRDNGTWVATPRPVVTSRSPRRSRAAGRAARPAGGRGTGRPAAGGGDRQASSGGERWPAVRRAGAPRSLAGTCRPSLRKELVAPGCRVIRR